MENNGFGLSSDKSEERDGANRDSFEFKPHNENVTKLGDHENDELTNYKMDKDGEEEMNNNIETTDEVLKANGMTIEMLIESIKTGSADAKLISTVLVGKITDVDMAASSDANDDDKTAIIAKLTDEIQPVVEALKGSDMSESTVQGIIDEVMVRVSELAEKYGLTDLIQEETLKELKESTGGSSSDDDISVWAVVGTLFGVIAVGLAGYALYKNITSENVTIVDLSDTSFMDM